MLQQFTKDIQTEEIAKRNAEHTITLLKKIAPVYLKMFNFLTEVKFL